VNGETAGFEVIGSQTVVGNSENAYRITWASEDDSASPETPDEEGAETNGYTAKAGNYIVKDTVGTLTVTDGDEDHPVDPDNVVTKTHEAGQYKLGDTVTFTITVTNIYDEAKTITLTEELANATLDQEVFENVPAGGMITATATYTVTSQDILSGGFTNKVTAAFSGGKTFENSDEVIVENVKTDLNVTKSSNVAEGTKATLNQLIIYTIKVENTGNVPYPNVVVKDELKGAVIEPGVGYDINADGNAVISKLAVGEPVEVTAIYRVTEQDILAGSIHNVATAQGDEIKDPDKPEDPSKGQPGGEGEDEVPTETVDTGLTVTKTSDVEAGNTAKLGQTITYTIRVRNTGNVSYPNVVVEDELAGAVIQPGAGYSVNADGKAVISELGVGETVDVQATYTVTEQDIIAGQIKNVAAAQGDPVQGVQPEDKDEEDVPTESRNPKLEVEKTVLSRPELASGEYVIGETIFYQITIRNVGNLTMTGLSAEDILTRPNGEQIVPDGFASVKEEIEKAVLKPGEEQKWTYAYEVTAQDLGGNLANAVTVTGAPESENPNPDKPDPDPTDSTDTTVTTETTKVTFSKLNSDGEELAGAELAIVDPILGEEVYSWTTDGQPREVAGVLTAGKTYYLTEKVVPEGYLLAADVEFTVPERFFDEQPLTVEMRDASAGDGTGSITATVHTAALDVDSLEYLDLVTEDATFYVRLFTDEAGAHPYGEAKEVHIQNAASGSTIFDGIPDGTYYVFETDASGKAMAFDSENSGIEFASEDSGTTNASYRIILTDGQTNVAEIDSAKGKTEAATDLTNVYASLPDGFFLNGILTVNKVVRKDGEQADVEDAFYVGLFSDPNLETADVAIERLANNGTIYINIQIEGDGKQTQTYWVFETDAEGRKVNGTEAFAYAVSGETSVSFDTLENGLSQEVTIINEEIEESMEIIDPGDEDPGDEEPGDEEAGDDKKTVGTSGTGASQNSSVESRSSSAPKTGDDSNIEWYLLLLAAALAEMAVVVSRKKRREE
jgi:uncharacterized repeat protein (TIGR01451 family)